MNRWVRRTAAGAVTAVAVVGVPLALASGLSVGWSVGRVGAVKAPHLAALTAASVAPHSTHEWAVGYSGKGSKQVAYAMHNAGHRWKPVPVGAASHVYLQGVAAASPTAIWAVGDRYSKAGDVPLVERSHGAGFSVVKSSLGLGSLIAVAASSPSNVWAIGSHADGAPLVARWNGHTWHRVSVDHEKVGLELVGVTASGPTNVWLLGATATGPAVAHWNGHAFVVSSHTDAPGRAILTSISTTSAHNVWMSGYVPGAGHAGSSRMAAVHFNGHSWAAVNVPSRGRRNVPTSIAAVGSRVYLAGYAGPKDPTRSTPFILERVGHGHWQSAHVAKPGKNSVLLAVTASSKAAVAVGSWYDGAVVGSRRTPPHPLIASRHGHAWRQRAR